MTCAQCGFTVTGEHALTWAGPVHDECFGSWSPCLGKCGRPVPFRVAYCDPCRVAREADEEKRHREQMERPAPAAPAPPESCWERWQAKGDALEIEHEWQDKLDREAQDYYDGRLTDVLSPEERRWR